MYKQYKLASLPLQCSSCQKKFEEGESVYSFLPFENPENSEAFRGGKNKSAKNKASKNKMTREAAVSKKGLEKSNGYFEAARQRLDLCGSCESEQKEQNKDFFFWKTKKKEKSF